MDYHELQYWNKQYKAGNFGETYEWLGSHNLIKYLHKGLNLSLPSKDPSKDAASKAAENAGSGASGSNSISPPLPPSSLRVLHLGCGNSEFGIYLEKYFNQVLKVQSADGAGAGKTANVDLLNADYSPIVINQMKDQFPEKKWCVMDACAISGCESAIAKEFVQDSSADYVIEKGLTDALLCEQDEKERRKMVSSVFSEVLRLLSKKTDGKFAIFTLDGDRLVKTVRDDIQKHGGNCVGIELVNRVECYKSGKISTDAEDPDWACSLLVYGRSKAFSGGTGSSTCCQKCSKKNVFSSILPGSRCLRCGCLDQSKLKSGEGKSGGSAANNGALKIGGCSTSGKRK